MQEPLNLTPGATVYGADGEKVGKMQTYGGNYIVVEKGFFFPTDYYIPISAITTASQDEVFLNVSKDEALNQGWDIQPTDDVLTAPNIAGDRALFEDTQMPGEGIGQQSWDEDTLLAEETVRVPVHEEQLDATKRQVAAGDVTVSKRVVTEQETIEVPVTEERVRVEWRAGAAGETADGEAFEEGSIEVPISREEIEVTKRTVRTGELEVSKERQERTQAVTDSVRREVVTVDDPNSVIEGGNNPL
jgi:uncharacterized protein (TIGR02271 family)